MHTVGQILKEERERKIYTIEDVEKQTKIRRELLEALEADNYSKLPPPTFVQGFIKNYAKFLGLDGQKLLAIYRREFSTDLHPPKVLEAFSNPVEKARFRITPARVFGLVVVVVILSFFVYLWFQYRQFVGTPNLTLTSPQDQISLDNPTVVVEGSTDPEVKVSINNQDVPTDSQGHFKEDIKLSSQVNKISVVAQNKFNQKTEIDRTVYLRR
ncbi:helix-turn-helix domain-containing protein [Candidatus Daviesbacteria bacterium]|nr:helix-turn-helix domain-containing protein [Candidatus Daviesbacteria bacterium]